MRRRLTDEDWKALFWTAKLSELEGEVFLRREVQGEPTSRLARELGRSEGTIRAIVSDARKKLEAHPWEGAERRLLETLAR